MNILTISGPITIENYRHVRFSRILGARKERRQFSNFNFNVSTMQNGFYPGILNAHKYLRKRWTI